MVIFCQEVHLVIFIPYLEVEIPRGGERHCCVRTDVFAETILIHSCLHKSFSKNLESINSILTDLKLSFIKLCFILDPFLKIKYQGNLNEARKASFKRTNFEEQIVLN